MKKLNFFKNAKLLNDKFDIIPLMYGSLGLEYITNENLNSDDIDILIPEIFITDSWNDFKTCLQNNNYKLFDEHEHSFEKDGVLYSYASIEELENFAEIKLSDIKLHIQEDVKFKLLTLEQYLKVYSTSIKDGYRINVRKKKDFDKIEFIKKQIQRSVG